MVQGARHEDSEYHVMTFMMAGPAGIWSALQNRAGKECAAHHDFDGGKSGSCTSGARSLKGAMAPGKSETCPGEKAEFQQLQEACLSTGFCLAYHNAEDWPVRV